MTARESVVGFFHDNVDDYEAKHYGAVRSFMSVRQTRILELVDGLGLPADAAVLDAGCGPGYLVERLAQRGFHVSAFDGAEGMLRATEARVKKNGVAARVSFKQGDIERLPYPDASFDLVCSAGVIEYLSTDSRVLAEMHRVLRPGGHLILPVTNSLSPVNYLDGFVEAFKRSPLLGPFNAVWRRLGQRPLLPRHFHVRKHRPSTFRESLRAAGFQLTRQVYFYFLPWPRPLDLLAPKATAALGNKLERFGTSSIGVIAEGYLTLSSKLPSR